MTKLQLIFYFMQELKIIFYFYDETSAYLLLYAGTEDYLLILWWNFSLSFTLCRNWRLPFTLWRNFSLSFTLCRTFRLPFTFIARKFIITKPKRISPCYERIACFLLVLM
jgi:hypothetical protein